MRSLFLILKKYQVLLLFLCLEGISLALVFQHNYYQNAVFYNSANTYVGSVLETSTSIESYFGLAGVNQKLSLENERLHTELEELKQLVFREDKKIQLDSSLIHQYEFTSARVVNNTTHRSKNYITINKGSNDGIRPGMGVIGPGGIIGKVKDCSAHYSIVISLLHTDLIVSAVIQKNNAIGRIQWDGKSYRTAKLLEISNHLNIKKGDTVLTSGYNKTFPPNTMIGTIQNSSTKSQTYYDIDVLLSTSFNQLTYVYIVKNKLEQEQKAIEIDSLTLRP